MKVEQILARADDFGMFQHPEEIRALVDFLVQRGLGTTLEIGTLHGGTAALWAQLTTVPEAFIISIDLPEGRFGGSYFGYTEDKCLERNAALMQAFPRFRGILGSSTDPATIADVRDTLKGGKLDFLFIDGDHSYAGVKADYDTYRPFVRPGGLVVFHDINDTPKHDLDGCEVARLWQELPGDKTEFTVNREWGGIGVLQC